MKYLVILITIFTLVGCASVPKQAEWPNDIPAYSYYVDAYNNDLDNQNKQDFDSYLKWVVGFYRGTELYSDGWHKISGEALASIEDPKDRANAEYKLAWIGEQVSAEWAKSNSLRVINTRHVSIWAMSLEESIYQGKLMTYIDEVVHDVDAILAGTIEPDDITDYRYFAESEDFFF